MLLAGCSSQASQVGPSPSPSPSPSIEATSTPSAASAQAIPPSPSPARASSVCRDPTEHVYHPDRLQLRNPCMTVTGTVAAVRSEPDGDYHILLRLDPPFAGLINARNVSGSTATWCWSLFASCL